MKSFVFHFEPFEENYLRILKPFLQGKAKVYLNNQRISLPMELVLTAKEKGCTMVATTSPSVAKSLVGWDDKKTRKRFSHTDYAGSIITKAGIEFLILPPLDWLVTVAHGRHCYDRYLSKFLHPENFIQLPDFERQWEVFTPGRYHALAELFATATYIACDIETGREGDRTINCIGFTAVHINSATKEVTLRTVVVPFTDMLYLSFARHVLDSEPAKVFQNGKYDIAYLLRYNMPVRNYAFDTINLMHCWFAELPKDLGFIGGYLLRGWIYWKDESDTNDLLTYYRYNAKDCFATALALLQLLTELPPYAIENYKQEFPVVFPCVLAEAIGIRADRKAMEKISGDLTASLTKELLNIQKMVNNMLFNPGSSQQTVKLLEVLGCGDLKSSDKTSMDKAASRHPLNKRIIRAIRNYREWQKIGSTYIDADKLWNDRWYYALNPHGTDTGRNASKESHFWCGLQIQNIPRDRDDVQVKDAFVCDEGFYFGEADLEQAEARDTAYLSGDIRLIAAVDDITKDYHGTNASAFFGVPYEEIVLSKCVEGKWIHKTINKALRDLAKRTNHGANYNMGAGVMLDTMGIENVIRAKKLLKLPSHWPLLKVCEYLLTKFSETYSTVKGAWYEKVKTDISTTHMLVGPTGWTRYCFGKPADNKRDLNRYVAHPPQSLNAMVLNRAFVSVFKNIWMNNPTDFRLHAQIHDSILFQYRIGRTDLAYAVKKEMEIPIQVKDTFGITRTLLVPAALKGEGTHWSSLKGME